MHKRKGVTSPGLPLTSGRAISHRPEHLDLTVRGIDYSLADSLTQIRGEMQRFDDLRLRRIPKGLRMPLRSYYYLRCKWIFSVYGETAELP